MPIPIVVTAAVIGGMILTGGIIYYCTLEGTYKIIETPAVKMGALALVIFAVGYFLFTRKK
jgi:hypothetical protein